MKFPLFFQKQELRKGIFLILLAWLCFSTMYLLSKLISNETTAATMLFFRGGTGLLIALPLIIKKWPKSIELNNWKVVVIRSLSGALSMCFIFLAVGQISLVNTSLLSNTAPFFVPFILWFWLRVPINHKMWPAILIGFIGIALVLQPNKHLFNMGGIYALLSGICLAFSLVSMRLATKSEALHTFLFYFFLVGFLGALPFAFFSWKVSNLWTLFSLIGIGVFSTLGQVAAYFAFKHGKAHQLAPFTYATVIFSGIYEWLVFHHSPAPIAYLGILFVIASGCWIVWVSKPSKEIQGPM